jgi:hypothetical protein
LEETLRELVYLKVDEKSKQLLLDATFTNLSNTEKIESIDKILLKIEEMKNNLVLQNESPNITQIVKANNEKKIVICDLMWERFLEFKNEI